MLYLNGVPVAVTIFPDKTSQVWKLPEDQLRPNKDPTVIRWQFEHEGEAMHLLQLKHLLASYGHECKLELPYLPYGRQDKPYRNDATFALGPFAEFLNMLKFKSVEILDPHSSRATHLINNSIAQYPIEAVCMAVASTDADVLCYPDDGAVKKYHNLYQFPYIFGEKVRDQSTGRITNYTLNGQAEGKRVLIVDDLCDGGATFVLLGTALLDAGALSISLFVSHGLFTKGLAPLRQAGINRIFTAQGEVLGEPDYD